MSESTRCDAANLTPGDRLSRIAYYEVVELQDDGVLVLQNEQGFQFRVSKGVVEAEMYSAHQFSEQKKVNKTEMVRIFENVGDAVFTVRFLKQAKADDLVSSLSSTDTTAMGAKALKDFAKELLKGEERTLVGYMVEPQTALGRSRVVDLNVPAGQHNLRLVDHRTISELVVKGVRYHL